MSKVAVVYWSGTGNTEQMAEQVAGAASAELITADEFNAGRVGEFDAIAFGCPSMGAEVLEEAEFQPMWDEVKGELSGKKIGLFGSYGWGDGEWMRNWSEECEGLGLSQVCEFVICCGAPGDSENDQLSEMGQLLAQ